MGNGAHEFLFQIGAIKRGDQEALTTLLSSGFYSKLVRLKEIQRLLHRQCPRRRFYSKLVRLKENQGW